MIMRKKEPENKSDVIRKIIPKPVGKEKGIDKIEKGNKNDE